MGFFAQNYIYIQGGIYNNNITFSDFLLDNQTFQEKKPNKLRKRPNKPIIWHKIKK